MPKEFKVTVYPRPRTYIVLAETEQQAARVADISYTSEAPRFEDVAYRHDVEEIIEELKDKQEELN